jgi:hypothetical protein
MLCLGKNSAWCQWKTLNGVFESKNYTRENNGAGHNFYSTTDKFESIPKPSYLGVVGNWAAARALLASP